MIEDLDPIAIALADALVHEDESQFIEAALPGITDIAIAGSNENELSEHRLMLSSLFSALPRSGNNYDFKNITMPGRNDPCLCGSGKKFKKCCADLNILDVPPSQSLFELALAQLNPSQINALLHKPNWTLKAIDLFVPLLMDVGEVEAVVALYEEHVGSVKSLRNEHEYLVSCVLDALFELQADDKRLMLMTELCQHSQAKTLQSIGYQRLAMIEAQQGMVANAKEHLQKAMRADPNQVELPMAEISILGLIAEEDEIISRARFWRARLLKRYEVDYPPIETMEQVISQGKSFFSNMLEASFEEDGHEHNENLELNKSNLLGAFLKSDSLPIYRLKSVSGEAKLMLGRVDKRNINLWQESLKGNLEDIDQSLDLTDQPEWVTEELAVLFELWLGEEEGWIESCWDNPNLLSSLEVLEELTALVYALAHLEHEDGLSENDEEVESLHDQLLEQLLFRKLSIVMNILSGLDYNGLTLPKRFKPNQVFWRTAEVVCLELGIFEGTEGVMNDLLEGLRKADSKPPEWLLNATAMHLFKQKQTAEVIEYLEPIKKLSEPLLIMLACSSYAENRISDALSALKTTNKSRQKRLIKLRTAFVNDDLKPLLETSYLPLFNALRDESLADYRDWLIRNLPS